MTSSLGFGCSLTVCQSLLPGGGGVCSQGGVVSQHALRQTPPTVNRMTDRCENITSATTSLRPVIIVNSVTACSH